MNWKGITLGLAALLATSCTNELDESSIDSSLREGEIALQWLPANMGIHKVQTKGTDPKTASEQKIYNSIILTSEYVNLLLILLNIYFRYCCCFTSEDTLK